MFCSLSLIKCFGKRSKIVGQINPFNTFFGWTRNFCPISLYYNFLCVASLSLVRRFSVIHWLPTCGVVWSHNLPIAGWTAWWEPPWGRPRPICWRRAPRRPRARPPGSAPGRCWWRGAQCGSRPPAPPPRFAHAPSGRWRGAPGGSGCAGTGPGPPRPSPTNASLPRRASASSSNSRGEASFARQP